MIQFYELFIYVVWGVTVVVVSLGVRKQEFHCQKDNWDARKDEHLQRKQEVQSKDEKEYEPS